MLAAAENAAHEQAAMLRAEAPLVLGVTVLTSMDDNNLAELGIARQRAGTSVAPGQAGHRRRAARAGLFAAGNRDAPRRVGRYCPTGHARHSPRMEPGQRPETHHDTGRGHPSRSELAGDRPPHHWCRRSQGCRHPDSSLQSTPSWFPRANAASRSRKSSTAPSAAKASSWMPPSRPPAGTTAPTATKTSSTSRARARARKCASAWSLWHRFSQHAMHPEVRLEHPRKLDPLVPATHQRLGNP